MTNRQAARSLRRYLGRARSRLRYRRATPPPGTRPGRGHGRATSKLKQAITTGSVQYLSLSVGCTCQARCSMGRAANPTVSRAERSAGCFGAQWLDRNYSSAR